MERPLSELLKLWRAEKPDEWTMDEFIREAEKMEKQIQNTSSNSDYAVTPTASPKLPSFEEVYNAMIENVTPPYEPFKSVSYLVYETIKKLGNFA